MCTRMNIVLLSCFLAIRDAGTTKKKKSQIFSRCLHYAFIVNYAWTYCCVKNDTRLGRQRHKYYDLELRFEPELFLNARPRPSFAVFFHKILIKPTSSGGNYNFASSYTSLITHLQRLLIKIPLVITNR